MKLRAVCPAPCFNHAPDFEIPRPACSRADLKFGTEGDRDFYAVLLRNHDLGAPQKPNPKVAVVGLSPGSDQMEEFLQIYRRTGSYAEASIGGAFANLAPDIIRMMQGLGLAEKLGINFENRSTLARHPDIYVTSLVACASLTRSGSSDDFDPGQLASTRACMTERFINEICDPAYTRLSHVVVLGAKGWKAVNGVNTREGLSVAKTLEQRGKHVMTLPHPAGQNGEYVRLASLPAHAFPDREAYAHEKWLEYRHKPPKKGRTKQSEQVYKGKRRSYWDAVAELRRQISVMETV